MNDETKEDGMRKKIVKKPVKKTVGIVKKVVEKAVTKDVRFVALHKVEKRKAEGWKVSTEKSLASDLVLMEK